MIYPLHCRNGNMSNIIHDFISLFVAIGMSTSAWFLNITKYKKKYDKQYKCKKNIVSITKPKKMQKISENQEFL